MLLYHIMLYDIITCYITISYRATYYIVIKWILLYHMTSFHVCYMIFDPFILYHISRYCSIPEFTIICNIMCYSLACYIILYDMSLYYNIRYDNILYRILLCYIKLSHAIINLSTHRDFTLHYVMLYDIVVDCNIQDYIILFYIISYYIIPWYVMLGEVMLYCIILFRILLC